MKANVEVPEVKIDLDLNAMRYVSFQVEMDPINQNVIDVQVNLPKT
jgi:hypothetical protein